MEDTQGGQHSQDMTESLSGHSVILLLSQPVLRKRQRARISGNQALGALTAVEFLAHTITGGSGGWCICVYVVYVCSECVCVCVCCGGGERGRERGREESGGTDRETLKSSFQHLQQ